MLCSWGCISSPLPAAGCKAPGSQVSPFFNNGTDRSLLPPTDSRPRKSPLAAGELCCLPAARAAPRWGLLQTGAGRTSCLLHRCGSPSGPLCAGGCWRERQTRPTGPTFPAARAPPGFRWPPRPRKPLPAAAAGGAAVWPRAGARTDRRGRERRGGWRRCGRF